MNARHISDVRNIGFLLENAERPNRGDNQKTNCRKGRHSDERKGSGSDGEGESLSWKAAIIHSTKGIGDYKTVKLCINACLTHLSN